MRKGYRTQDYHLIKDTTDALYYAADIPSTQWGPLKNEIPTFKLLVMGEDNISPKTQTDFFQRLRNKELFHSPILAIMSSDTDDSVAVGTGYDLMKRAVLSGVRVQITESSRIKEEISAEETVFMLTNITDDAPQERIQEVRDWCYRHRDCFRLICAGGDPSVIIRRTKLKFNAAFYLSSREVEERNMV